VIFFLHGAIIQMGEFHKILHIKVLNLQKFSSLSRLKAMNTLNPKKPKFRNSKPCQWGEHPIDLLL